MSYDPSDRYSPMVFFANGTSHGSGNLEIGESSEAEAFAQSVKHNWGDGKFSNSLRDSSTYVPFKGDHRSFYVGKTGSTYYDRLYAGKSMAMLYSNAKQNDTSNRPIAGIRSTMNRNGFFLLSGAFLGEADQSYLDSVTYAGSTSSKVGCGPAIAHFHKSSNDPYAWNAVTVNYNSNETLGYGFGQGTAVIILTKD